MPADRTMHELPETEEKEVAEDKEDKGGPSEAGAAYKGAGEGKGGGGGEASSGSLPVVSTPAMPAAPAAAARLSAARLSADGGALACDRPAAVWEVMLCGQFKPFDELEQAALEAAFRRGERTAPVRGGRREVTLASPHVQRQAAGRTSPCKLRDVRRRVVAPPTSSQAGTAQPSPTLLAMSTKGPLPRDAQYDPGTRLRVRWAAGEPFRCYEVRESSRFELADAAAGELHHCMVEEGPAGSEAEWYNLCDADAVHGCG